MRKLFHLIFQVLLAFALQDAAFAQDSHSPKPSTVQMADQVWDEKGWTQETMDEFLQTHMRTPYKNVQSEGSN